MSSHKKAFIKGAGSAFLLIYGFLQPAYAINLPPSSASSDLIQKKAVEEARKKMLEHKPVEEYIPPASSPPPAKPEASFELKKIILRAAPVMSPENRGRAQELFPLAESLLKAYEGRKVTLRQLNELKDALENLFRQKGYFSVLTIPAQKSQAGEVVFEVLLSQMGKIQMVKPLKYGRSRRLLSKWNIPEGAILNYELAQKALVRMNENPDRSIAPVFKAGEKPGSTDVYLEAQERFPIHPSYTFDNKGSKSVGKVRNGFRLRDTNFLTLDDALQVGTAFGSAFGVLYVQHMLPLNDRGTRLMSGYSFSKVAPQKEFASSGILSTSTSYSTSIHQELLRTQKIYADCYAGFDFKEKHTTIQNEAAVWDRLRVLSTGIAAQMMDKTGIWGLGADFYFGIPIHGDGYPLNSRGAETSFFKTDLSLSRQQKLFWQTRGIFTIDAQLSPDRLMAQEQKSFGGADSIRGYPESDYLSDQGISFSAEYQAPFFLVPREWKLPYAEQPLRQQITLLSFLDHGYGEIRGALSSEDDKRKMTGVGGGFSIRLRNNLTARFIWAAAVGAHPLTEGGRSQFHFSVQTEV